MELSYGDVKAAAARIEGLVRPVTVAPAEDLGPAGSAPFAAWFALEYLQHTGTFKARGAQNFLQAHREAGDLPAAGVTIASGGNAGLACAWAARRQGVPATVFLPATAPPVKVERLRGYGAQVRLVGTEYAQALEASQEFAAAGGALLSAAYDHPLIAAGAGTVAEEIHALLPALDTIVVAVGGGGLFSGVATAAGHYGVRTIAVEPANCRALHAGLAAGAPVDVEVNSIAADSLGARRTTALAIAAARRYRAESVLVTDDEIIAARRQLWSDRRIVVEHGAATALAALTSGRYRPAPGERVCVVLCGANTDPSVW
ncbi:threonine/serine dehydratase [Nocardia sp. NPDC127579]|uniref:threonine/serine dehydratase n=1 Tax=Nocardia sp. NPDC127579 TaxID=3345402 RepID=UPI00363AAD72